MARRRRCAEGGHRHFEKIAFRHVVSESPAVLRKGGGRAPTRSYGRSRISNLHDFLFLGGERAVDFLHSLVRRLLNLGLVALFVVLGDRMIL